jgi:hypothetical protein
MISKDINKALVEFLEKIDPRELLQKIEDLEI